MAEWFCSLLHSWFNYRPSKRYTYCIKNKQNWRYKTSLEFFFYFIKIIFAEATRLGAIAIEAALRQAAVDKTSVDEGCNAVNPH